MAQDVDAILEALSGGFDPQQAKLRLLQQQLEQANALSGSQPQQAHSVVGRVLNSGLSGIDRISGALQARQARQQMGGILDQQAQQQASFRELMAQRAQQKMAREQSLLDPKSAGSLLRTNVLRAALPGVDVPEGIAGVDVSDQLLATVERGQAARDAAEARKYAAQQAALERRFAREDRASQAAERAADKKEKDLDKQIETLSKRVELAPALKNDLDTLDEFAAKEDIPGVGLTGRLPDLLVSSEGTRVRQAAKGVLSTIIKQKSGTAASDKEVERLMSELGMGPNATDDQFRAGIKRMRKQAADVLRAQEAGARPEAVEEARRRGLTTSHDFGPAGQPQTKVGADGKTYRLNARGKWERL